VHNWWRHLGEVRREGQQSAIVEECFPWHCFECFPTPPCTCFILNHLCFSAHCAFSLPDYSTLCLIKHTRSPPTRPTAPHLPPSSAAAARQRVVHSGVSPPALAVGSAHCHCCGPRRCPPWGWWGQPRMPAEGSGYKRAGEGRGGGKCDVSTVQMWCMGA
jgi:hypothetical protein